MADNVLKGNFVCDDCNKKQTWVYQELKGNHIDSGRVDVVKMYKTKENEVIISRVSEDKKTGNVYCSDGRCGYPNTVNLKEGIQSKI